MIQLHAVCVCVQFFCCQSDSNLSAQSAQNQRLAEFACAQQSVAI